MYEFFMSKKLQLTLFFTFAFILIFPSIVDFIKYTFNVDITKTKQQKILEEKTTLSVFIPKNEKVLEEAIGQFGKINNLKLIIETGDLKNFNSKKSYTDVIILDNIIDLVNAKDADLFTSSTSEQIEKNIAKNFRDIEGYWHGLSVRANLILYNSALTNNKEIRSYDNLANSKWLGKILLSNQQKSSFSNFLIFLLTKNKWQQEDAKSYLRKFNKNIKNINIKTNEMLIDNLLNKNGQLALMESDSFLKIKNSDKTKNFNNISFFIPNSGVNINIKGLGISKNAKNEQAGIKLIEYLSSATVQEYIAKINFEYPVNPKAKVFGELENFGIIKKSQLPIDSIRNYANYLNSAVRERFVTF